MLIRYCSNCIHKLIGMCACQHGAKVVESLLTVLVKQDQLKLDELGKFVRLACMSPPSSDIS